MTPTKRTVTAELDMIARLAAGLPVERTEDSITISDTTLDRRYIFFVRPGVRGIRITCWESRGHLIGRDRKYMVRKTLRDGYGLVAGLVRYARYAAEREAAEAAAAETVEVPPAAMTLVFEAKVADIEADLAARTLPGVTPRVVRVDITAGMDSIGPCYDVTPVWEADGGLDRPIVGGWSVDDLSDGRRLRAAVLAGAVYPAPVVARDVNGKTYVRATSTVMAKYLNADLRRIGF